MKYVELIDLAEKLINFREEITENRKELTHLNETINAIQIEIAAISDIWDEFKCDLLRFLEIESNRLVCKGMSLECYENSLGSKKMVVRLKVIDGFYRCNLFEFNIDTIHENSYRNFVNNYTSEKNKKTIEGIYKNIVLKPTMPE